MRNYKDARKFLVNSAFIQSRAYGDQLMRADETGVHPDLLAFNNAFVAKCASFGMPVFSNEIWRSPERQNELNARGNSNAGAYESPHQYGCATDIVSGLHFWDVPRLCWDILGHMGHELAIQKGIDITWGGEFRTLYDPAHWELTHWKKLSSFPRPPLKQKGSPS